jgi:hypothetical protein
MDHRKPSSLFFILIFAPLCCVRARPIDQQEQQQQPSDEGQSIIELLKQGDAETWQQHGPTIVDMVNEMVDRGLAADPFDGLLLFFYPNSSEEERKETLKQFEPLLRALLKMSSSRDVEESDDLFLNEQPNEYDDALSDGFPEILNENFDQQEGQQEQAVYLDTHEMPTGWAWRH